MYVTLSLRDIAVGLVLIALVILIIYIAIFFKNLIRTLKASKSNVGSGVLAQLSNIAAAINSIIKIIGRKK